MGSRQHPCPMCKKNVVWEGNASRPFCSERCRLLDLEGWFSEQYRIPQDEGFDADDSMEHNGDQVNGPKNF